MLGISVAFAFSNDVFPSTKQFPDFAVHCFPLVIAYLFWSVSKENNVAAL
jgi:hypothetical protein